MKISIGSGCYAGGCLVLGALNAYANPVQWITTFAVGVLAGLWLNSTLIKNVLLHQDALDTTANTAANTTQIQHYQKKVNETLDELISNAIPGKIATGFNLLAGGLNWIPRIDVSIKRGPGEAGPLANFISSFVLGLQVGSLIQLGRLWFNSNPGLQQKLKEVVL